MDNEQPVTEQVSTPAPQAAPTSPAPSAAPPATSAAERAAREINEGRPARKSFEEIEAEMNGTASAAPQQDSPGDTGDGTKAGTGLPPQAGQPPSTETPAEQVVPVDPRVAQLEADLRARDEIIARHFPQGVTPGAVPQQPQATPPVDDIPQHMYQIPEQFLQGLRSEDPIEANRALTGYTSLVMKTLHKAVRTEMEQKLGNLLQKSLPQMVQQFIEHNTQTKAVYEDFYNNNKDLNKPELYDVIVKTAMNMAQNEGYTTWNAKFRDDLATRIRKLLGIQATPQAPRQQPAMMSTGARPAPAAQTPQDKLANEIMSLADAGYKN